MCLSKAYIDRDGNREMLAEEVVSLGVSDGRLLLKTLFGELKEVNARIREIDFLTHTILLEGSREENISG